MGLFGKLSSLWSGRPSAPKQKPYTPDPFVGSQGFQDRLGGADQMAFQALTDYMQREPGLSEEEKRAMFMLPAEQLKLGEQSALKRLNQGAAFGGKFKGGERVRGRGDIMSKTAAGQAEMKRRSVVQAAQIALQDRLNQIAAANRFVIPRMGASQAETRGLNWYSMGENQIDMAKWKAELDQYNMDFDWAWDQAMGGGEYLSGVLGGGGGGGGGAPFMGIMTSGAAAGCWVAVSIFGGEDARWLQARHYVLNVAPSWFRRFYLRYGEAIAKQVRRFGALRLALRPLFGYFAVRGRKDLEG